MKNYRLERLEHNRIAARLSRVLPALLLPTLLLILLLCGLSRRTQAGPTGQTGPNLVSNPGFEERIPDSWQCEGASPPTCGCRWSGVVSHTGNHSAEIWGNESWCACQWRSDTFTVHAGALYVFSGWIKADNVMDRALLTLAFYTSTSPSPSTPPITECHSSRVKGSSEWITVTSSCVAPDSAQSARIYCRLIGQGTAWFDDIYAGRVMTPMLVVSKSDTPDPVEPEQSLVYTIAYSNTGTGTATGVVITDVLPVSVRRESASVTPTKLLTATNTLVWENLDDLDPGAVGTITVTTGVSSPLGGGSILTNWVVIGCSETVSATDIATTTVYTDRSVLTVVPVHISKTAPPGQGVCYTHMLYLTGDEPRAVSIAAASSRGWLTQTSPTSICLQSGSPGPITACVTVPAGCETVSGTVDTLTVTASLLDIPGETAMARDTTTVDRVLPGIPVVPRYQSAYNYPEQHPRSFGFVHRITNTGNYTDGFELEIIDDSCPGKCPQEIVRIVPTSLTVGCCQSFTATVYITVTQQYPECWARVRIASRFFPQTYTDFLDEVRPPARVYLPVALRNFHTFCNGGFETGDFTCWTRGGELDQSVQSEIVHEGNYAALLGNADYPCRGGVPTGTARISQTLSVPSCPNPVLSFEYRIFSNDILILGDDRWDSFDVYINDTLILRDGDLESDEASCDREPWDSKWKDFSCNLSAYKGQNIEISFHNASRLDQYYNTWTYVDLVEVVCKP